MVDVAFLAWPDPSFPQRIDELRTLLGAPDNPLLLPSHFLKAAFPNLGGRVAVIRSDDAIRGAAFLFPRAVAGGEREYTLRYHRLHDSLREDEIARAVERALHHRVRFYDPSGPLTFAQEPPVADTIELVLPDEQGARAIRDLQHEIWRHESVDSLYPVDIHSNEFDCALSLRARIGNRTAGFLFGFRKFDNTPLPAPLEATSNEELRLESQVMAVHPDFRRADIAFKLKIRQAELAREASIATINWTFDPLQYANARLNFGRLGAVAFDFHRSYYDFTNALNIVPASRLAITWLVNSPRARAAARSPLPEAELGPDIALLNDGPRKREIDPGNRFALEVPQDWTALQRENRELALAWRDTTDDLLDAVLATKHYAITGTARLDDRYFITGERIAEQLIATLIGQALP